MRLFHSHLRWLAFLLCLVSLLSGSRAFATAVAQPAIQLQYGTASAQYQAQISCATPGAVIHYSITGLDPTTSDPVVASGSAVTITQNVTLKAMAWDGNTPATLTPSPVATQVCNVFGRVAAGDDDSLVLKSDGRLWSSGLNSSGQLGDGTLTNRTAPVSVMKVAGTILKNVISVDGGPGNGSGVEHTVAALSNGTVWAWGSNSNGQLGNTPTGTPQDSPYPVAVVKSDGSALTNVVMVAAGNKASYALTADGKVYAWGINNKNQLGDGTATQRNYAVTVKTAGGADFTGVTQIAAGEWHVLALKTGGTVWAWGYNNVDQLGDGTYTNAPNPIQVVDWNGTGHLTGVSKIAAAYETSIALKSATGSVWSWGFNPSGQLGDGTISDGVYPTQMKTGVGSANFIDVVDIGAGRNHTLLLKSTWELYSVGGNARGQLGNGNTTSQSFPVPVKKDATHTLGNIATMAGGYAHSVVVDRTGVVYTFGKNVSGALGSNNTTDSSYAVAYAGWPNTLYVSTAVTLTVASNSSTNPNSFLLTATPNVPSDEISRIDFYQGTTFLGSVTSGPWQLAVTNAALDQPFTAVAYNQNGTMGPAATLSGTISRVFRLPLTRMGHSLQLHRLGGGTPVSPSSTQVKSIASVDGTGHFVPASDAYLEVTFPMSQMDQFWLMDDTSGEYAQLNAVDLRGTFWALDQPYQPGGGVTASTILHLMIPVLRAPDAFDLILDTGTIFPVTPGTEQYGNAINPTTGVLENRSFGFIGATAYPQTAASGYHVLDLTTFEQSPANTANLLGATWSPINLPTITRAAKIALSAANAGYAFTMHTSNGSLGGLTAGPVNFASDNYTGTGLSASIGIGASFWLTRDVDGASSPHLVMGISNQFVDWTPTFPAYRNLQTKRFLIGGTRRGHTFKIVHSDGYITTLTMAAANNTLTTWGQDGHTITYAYDALNGIIDLNQASWYLKDDTTGENLGAVTTALQGWSPWHPAPAPGSVALNISQARHGHALRLHRADGTDATVQPMAGYEDPAASVQAWNTAFAGTPQERTAEIDYFPAQAVYDPTQSFTIFDDTTGEQQAFAANTVLAELSQWSGAAEPLTLDITVTRWQHELLLLEADGTSYPMVKGNLQGTWTPTLANQGWFTTSNYFDATTSHKPAMEWWVYDVTTGEMATSYLGDLTQWIGPGALVDTDDDGLPDWYEFVLGTNPNAADTDGDGIPDGWEVRYGLNPLSAADASALSVDGLLTNLQKYQNGLNPTVADTDGDGIPDAWELAHGLNATNGGDATALAPGDDLLTNLQVFQGYTALRYKAPVGLAGHQFSLLTETGTIAATRVALVSSALDPSGGVPPAADSYLQVAFVTLLSFDTAPAVRDEANGRSFEPGTFDLRNDPYYDFSNTQYFVLPLSRISDAFVVMLENGTTYPVTLGTGGSGLILDPPSGNLSQGAYGFFTAVAYVMDWTSPPHLIDLTTLEQTDPNPTGAAVNTWSPLNLPQITRTATIKMAPHEARFTFTLHTSGGSLQSVTPSWTTIQLPGPDNSVTGYFVTGPVGIGETFWLTRDQDLARSVDQQLAVTDVFVDWTAQFQAIRNLQNNWFGIGGARKSDVFAVHHDDGLVNYLYNPTAAQLITWDDNGQPVTYDYYRYLGYVDTNQGWWLVDETTGDNLGASFEVLDGWNSNRPTPPAGFVAINLPQGRHSHALQLIQDDGTTWNVSPSAGYTDLGAFNQAWLTYSTDGGDSHTQAIDYYPAQAPYDPAQGFTIVDTTTTETYAFPAGTTAAELSRWFGSAQTLTLKISVVRWTHELVLHQADGSSFPITRGNLQGSWTPAPGDQAWFTTYTYFDAGTQFHTELDWWVYDVTTGESSPIKTNDLSTWMGSSVNLDTDGDGLPDWYEFIIGTDPNVNDGDGNGIPDWWEHQNFGSAGLQLLLSNTARAALALGTAWLHSPFDPIPGQNPTPGGGNSPITPDPDPQPPQPPALTSVTTHLVTDANGNDQFDLDKVDVKWTGAGADSFLIERKSGRDPWITVATPGGNSAQCLDSGLLANIRYSYRVTARTSHGSSQPSNVVTYVVPLSPSFRLKSSVHSAFKIGFTDFMQNDPPTYYLNSSEFYNSSTTHTDDLGKFSSSITWLMTKSFVPSTHSRSEIGSLIDASSYTPTNPQGHATSSIVTDNWQLRESKRSRENTTASFFSTRTRNYDDTSSVGVFNTFATYVADNGIPLWAGDDYEMNLGIVTWTGGSSSSITSSNSSDIGNSAMDPEGYWTGSSTLTESDGSITTSQILGAPIWSAGGWAQESNYSGWGNPVSPAQLTYSFGNGDTNANAGTTLSGEYTTAAFIADTIHDLPDYQDASLLNAIWPWVNDVNWGQAVFAAERSLSADESNFTIAKSKYRVHAGASAPTVLKWYEVFVPENDPNPPDSDESGIAIFNPREWYAGQEQDSPEYEIDPSILASKGNGQYYLTFAASLTVWDSKDDNAVPLDETAKKTPGVQIHPTDPAGTTHFVVMPTNIPNAKYELLWNTTQFGGGNFKVYSDTTHAEISPGYMASAYESFYIVADNNVRVGNSIGISLNTIVGQQSVGNDSFGATLVDPSVPGQNFTIPIDDTSGPRYRKIALNGRPMADEKPQHTAESDQEKEETFIDAMTLGLRHSVTDIFVPVPGSDLVLAARRNVAPMVWNMRSGLRPHERRDLPFGAGWTSSLAPTVEIVTAPNEPVYAYVLDESGTSHRFIQWVDGQGAVNYVPSPSSRVENSDYQTSFKKSLVDATKWIFTSRYGTAITFEDSNIGTTFSADRVAGSQDVESHHFWRATTVADRLGKALNFEYGGATLVPDTISVAGSQTQKIWLQHNAQGQVTAIWDPKGLQTTFGYDTVAYEQNGVNYTVPVLKQVTGPDAATSNYTYDFFVEGDLTPLENSQLPTPKLHLDIASIADPLGQTYAFTYLPDQSKWDFKTGYGYFQQTGLPRNIATVTLPLPDHPQVAFANHSHLFLQYNGDVPSLTPDSLLETQVTDAEGHATTYTWGTPAIFLLNSIAANPATIPKLICFQQMTVNFSGLYTQNYTFDLNAGFAVNQVQVKQTEDANWHTTTFAYGDQWSIPEDSPYRQVFSMATFNGNYSDPTVQTNALGLQKTFHYYGAADGASDAIAALHLMSKVTDEAMRVTYNDFDPQGRRVKETIQDAQHHTAQVTDFHYGNATFPGVVTERIIEGGAGFPDLVTQFELDNEGRVISERVDPNGLNLVTQSAYDADGCKISSTDPNGNTTYFGYDARNRLTGVAYPDQSQKSMAYDARGNKIRETDEKNHLTRFTYDKMNRLIEQRRIVAAGAGDVVTSFGYNNVGSRTSVTDPNHNTITTDCDELQRPTKITNPPSIGGATTFGYAGNSGSNAFDSTGFKATSMTDANGYVTTTTNDALYRPVDISVEYAHGSFGITHTVYDAVGNPTSVTDPLGKVTLMEYDALNRVVKTTYHDDVANSNVTTSAAYSRTGLKWKVTDELSRDTITVFDTAGRPVQVQAPPLAAGMAPATTQTVYDNNGNVVATIDPLGRQTDVTYDVRNRKVRVAGPLMVVNYATNETARPMTDTVYDAVGNVIRTADPRNSITTMEYDEANRKTKVTAPAVPVASQLGSASPVTTTEYDPAGNALRVTDANGHITVNTYDAMNRLLTTTVHATADGPGITVANSYDAMGNRLTVTDGNLQSTSFTYDGLKRNTSVADALGHTTSFAYNAVNKTGRTDALNHVTSYTYDYRHRLTGVQYGNHSPVDRTYAYDAAGRLLSVTEPGKGGKADVSYGYDAMNRVVSETSGGVMHLYEYDLAGNRTKVTYGGTGRILNSTYDALNRLNKVVEGVVEGGLATQYQYDLSGNVLRKILPNGDIIDTTYDALGRSATISGTSTAPNRADQPLYHYTQAHDAGGNVVAIAEQTADLAPRFVSMGYDGLDRLVSENDLTGGQAKTTTYGYDDNNNRASRTIQDATGIKTTSYSYDHGNRLTGLVEGARSVTYGYNDAGSRTTQTENGVLKASYTYDEEQRLIGLTQESQTYAYTYDYRTRRVERVEGASDTKVVFSGGTSVQELEGNAPVVEYIRGSDWGGGVGGILYTVRGGAPSFTHYDSRGDVTAKTDATGAVTYQASYESFGKRTQEQGATADRQKANTKEEDPSGLLNEGMRYRDLETGTFITADPAGFVDGPNLYAYVRQNPWTMFDPEGLCEAYSAAAMQEYWSQTRRPDFAPPTPMPAPTKPKGIAGWTGYVVATLGDGILNTIGGLGGGAAKEQYEPNPIRRAFNMHIFGLGLSQQEYRQFQDSSEDLALALTGGGQPQLRAPEFKPKLVPNPNGRNGKPDHQIDVNNNNNLQNPPLVPETVGGRVPDGVGQPNQTVNIRNQPISPEEGQRVIVESERYNQNGHINSDGRDQIRQVRAGDLGATIVVTDPADSSRQPTIFPPGAQPPPKGNLPPGTPTSVPAPLPPERANK